MAENNKIEMKCRARLEMAKQQLMAAKMELSSFREEKRQTIKQLEDQEQALKNRVVGLGSIYEEYLNVLGLKEQQNTPRSNFPPPQSEPPNVPAPFPAPTAENGNKEEEPEAPNGDDNIELPKIETD